MHDKDIKEKKEKTKKVSIFKVISFGLKVNIKTGFMFFMAVNIVTIFFGVSYGFSTFVTQHFYDSVEDVITNNEPINRAYLMIITLGLAFILKEVLNVIHSFMQNIMFTKASGEMSKIIHEKMARIEPICFENTELHNDIEKASAGAGTVMGVVRTLITIFTFHLPYFIFMGIYLHHLKPQFVFAIALVFIPILLSQFIRTGIISKFEDKAAPIRRKYNFYHEAIVDREYYKETRILGAYSFFFKRLMTTMKSLNNEEWSMNKKVNLFEFCMSILSASGYAGILYMLVSALLSGDITVGAFAAVFSSIGMLYALVGELINRHIGNIASNMGQAHNFIRFMDIPERIGTDSVPIFEKGITADNISFIYPYAENKSVDSVSLEIKAGETVAIVGVNGAGKTTLVRLLIGLYTPSEGKVTINGMDTTKVNNKSLFHGLSGVFQRYQRYQMTLKENVQISDFGNTDPVENVMEQAGVDIKSSSFPDGTSTMLSREFDGVDLSGGEWQRIAIARALYRNHEVIVLDEPTAAIDPIEESRIYRKFVEISKNKTAIIVTHRLGSTKIADRVIVMDKGKVVDVGSHYELLKKQGLYADMFNSQASWYEESPKLITANGNIKNG